MKLGKKPPKLDDKRLYLSKYTRLLPTAPSSISWTKGVKDWGMLANDTLGDCTIAAVGHAVQLAHERDGLFVDLTTPSGADTTRPTRIRTRVGWRWTS